MKMDESDMSNYYSFFFRVMLIGLVVVIIFFVYLWLFMLDYQSLDSEHSVDAKVEEVFLNGSFTYVVLSDGSKFKIRGKLKRNYPDIQDVLKEGSSLIKVSGTDTVTILYRDGTYKYNLD